MPGRPSSESSGFPEGSSRSEGARLGVPPVVNGNGHFNGANANDRDSIPSNESYSEAEGADPPLSPCVMTVILQPPTDVRPGEVFHSPVIVSLESRPTGNRRHDIPQNDARYWALASIRRHDGSNVLAGETLATIRRADTPQRYPNMGYLVFSDLKVFEPGNFKIYISLIQMPGTTGQSGLQRTIAAGTKIDAVTTNEINVEEDAVMMPRRESVIDSFCDVN